jgi:hypothetical protein
MLPPPTLVPGPPHAETPHHRIIVIIYLEKKRKMKNRFSLSECMAVAVELKMAHSGL